MKKYLGIGAIAFLIIIAFSFKGLLKNLFDSLEIGNGLSQEEKEEVVQNHYDANVGIVNQSNINRSNNFYTQIAYKQKEYMSGVGTNEAMLKNTLEDLNTDELNLVYAIFGQQEYDAPLPFFSGKIMDLFGWYKKELNETELNEMQLIWDKTNKTIR